MSSVTYALREQISLREDLEMQLSQTQEDLTKSGKVTGLTHNVGCTCTSITATEVT